MKIIASISLLCCILACNKATPQKTVAVTVLNTNLISSRYAPSFFNELQEMKRNDRINVYKNDEMGKGTAEEYVQQNAILPIKDALKKVEDLVVTDDASEMRTASIELLSYSKTIFEKDFINIAIMIDSNQPQLTIDSAIQQMYKTHDTELDKRFRVLDELAIPYAEKNNVPLTFNK